MVIVDHDDLRVQTHEPFASLVLHCIFDSHLVQDPGLDTPRQSGRLELIERVGPREQNGAPGDSRPHGVELITAHKR